MGAKKQLVALNGSASENSSNEALLLLMAEMTESQFEFTFFNDLAILPHFKTALTENNTPKVVVDFREAILSADAVLICTPEYVFSIPSGLKNALEWCVSTTVFSDKPIGLITASAQGEKGHEELKLIMKTLQAQLTEETTLLIQGVRGKINKEGKVVDGNLLLEFQQFIDAFKKSLED